MPAQRRHQAEVVEDRRPELERQFAHHRERPVERFQRRPEQRGARRPLPPTDALEIQLGRGQDLSELVVQLARDAPPLLLLRREQSPRDCAQDLVGPFALGDVDRCSRQIQAALSVMERELVAQPGL
jgi:hypothetical protein